MEILFLSTFTTAKNIIALKDYILIPKKMQLTLPKELSSLVIA